MTKLCLFFALSNKKGSSDFGSFLSFRCLSLKMSVTVWNGMLRDDVEGFRLCQCQLCVEIPTSHFLLRTESWLLLLPFN